MALRFCIFAILLSITFGKSLVSIKTPVVSIATKNPEFQIAVEGDPIESIAVKSFKHVSSGKVITSNQVLEKVGDKYVVGFGKEKPEIGLYKIQLTVTTKDGTSTDVFNAKISIPVEISSAKILGEALAFPAKIPSGKKLSHTASDKISVTVAVKDKINQDFVEPHQAFLKFTHTEKKTHAYFILQVTATKYMRTVLDLAMEGSTFGYNSGKYNIELLIADSVFEKSLRWDLGQIHLSLPAAPLVQPSPLYAKALLHETDTTLEPLPEISHVMRTPDTRPPAIISLFFTILAIAPFFGFISYILCSGTKLSNFPRGFDGIIAFGFLGSIASILALFVLYWVKLSMFCTLGYLVPLGSASVVFGHQALRRSAASSTCEAKKKND